MDEVVRRVVIDEDKYERQYLHKGCGGILQLVDATVDVAFSALGAKKTVITGIAVRCMKCGREFYLTADKFW